MQWCNRKTHIGKMLQHVSGTLIFIISRCFLILYALEYKSVNTRLVKNLSECRKYKSIVLLSPCNLFRIHRQTVHFFTFNCVCACFFPVISLLSFLAPPLTQMAMHLLNWYFCGVFLSAKQQTLTTPISFIHYFARRGNKAGDHVGKAN